MLIRQKGKEGKQICRACDTSSTQDEIGYLEQALTTLARRLCGAGGSRVSSSRHRGGRSTGEPPSRRVFGFYSVTRWCRTGCALGSPALLLKKCWGWPYANHTSGDRAGTFVVFQSYQPVLGRGRGCRWASFSAQDTPTTKRSARSCQECRDWETLF